MIETLCAHSEESDALYRHADRLMCIDCFAYEAAKVERKLEILKREMRDVDRHLCSMKSTVGCDPGGSSLLESPMKSARIRVLNDEVNE
jgi:hypothetical protein